jgi:HKD family nuclease
MAIQILSNLNYPIGNIINQELQNAKNARMAVAFMKYSGL